MPSKVVKEYTLQIGPPIGLDGDNGDDFVHVFWMYNDSSQDMSDLRLEEISDDLNAVTYSFDGINYGDTLIKEHLGAYSSAPIYVKIDIPSGVNEGRYSAKMRLVFYDVIEWVFNLYYNVIASRTYLSQNKNFNIGSMPIVVTSVSDALELQDNIVETASGNVRAGDRYRKQNRRLEFVIADKQPSQEKTAIEEILPDGNIIELKKGSANIYVVDNTNGIIYELYPQAHKSSINPNAPKFRRASVAYKSDGTQVRYHEPRIVDETIGGRTGVLVEEGTTNLFDPTKNNPDVQVVTEDVDGVPTTVYKLDATANADYEDFQTGSKYPCDPTKIYTITWKAKWNSRTIFDFRCYDSSGAYIGLATHSIVVNPNPDPTKYQYYEIRITSFPPGTTQCEFFRWWYSNTDNTSIGYIARPQLEARPYATSWIPGGTTRAAETLTMPTAGVLDPNEGTIELWAYLSGDAAAAVPSRQYCFFGHDTTGGGPLYNRILLSRTSDGRLRFQLTNGTGQASEILAAWTPTVGWHYIAATWSAQQMVLYADGVRLASVNNPYRPDQLHTVAYVGSWVNNRLHLNCPIASLRISRRARTDQEIAAAYAAGILTEDADTTYLLSFRNDSILTNYPLSYNHFNIKPLANNPIDPITDIAHDGTNLWVLVGSRLYKTDEDGYEITSFNNATFTQLVAITDYNSQFLLGNTLNGVIYSINKATGAVVTFINASATGRQYDCLSFDGKYLWWRDKTANELVQFIPSAPYRVVNRIPAVNGSFAVYRSGYFVVKDGKTYKVYRGSLARQLLADFENELKNNRGIVTITDDRGVKIRGLVQDYQVSHLRNLDSVAYKVSMNVRQLG